jgi:hypothetical protein
MEHAADALNRHAVARLTDFSAYSAKSATIGAGIDSALVRTGNCAGSPGMSDDRLTCILTSSRAERRECVRYP